MRDRVYVSPQLVDVMDVVARTQMVQTRSGSPNGIGSKGDDDPVACWAFFAPIVLLGLLYAAFFLPAV